MHIHNEENELFLIRDDQLEVAVIPKRFTLVRQQAARVGHSLALRFVNASELEAHVILRCAFAGKIGVEVKSRHNRSSNPPSKMTSPADMFVNPCYI